MFIDIHDFETGKTISVNPNHIASIGPFPNFEKEDPATWVFMITTIQTDNGVRSQWYRVRESREEVVSASMAAREQLFDEVHQKFGEPAAEVLNPNPQKHAAKEAQA